MNLTIYLTLFKCKFTAVSYRPKIILLPCMVVSLQFKYLHETDQ